MSENHLGAWEADWKQHRPFLISFAYRLTGSLAEAEDLVQETFLECAGVPRSEVRNSKSWLAKVCANKGIDHLKSAYKRRETYPGPWLPDVIPDSLQVWTNLEASESPEQTLIRSESLTTSFLLLAERLTPEEEFTRVSSRPGLVISRRLPSGLWTFETILSFEIHDGRIARIYAQRNPDKLKALLARSGASSFCA